MKSREARRDDSIKHFNYHRSRELQQPKSGPLRHTITASLVYKPIGIVLQKSNLLFLALMF